MDLALAAQAFNGIDGFPFGFYSQDGAGLNGPAGHEDSAVTAAAVVTPQLGPKKPKAIA